jgi:hypothetical protein
LRVALAEAIKTAALTKLWRARRTSIHFQSSTGGELVIHWYRDSGPSRVKRTALRGRRPIATTRTTFPSSGTATIELALSRDTERAIRHLKVLHLTAIAQFSPPDIRAIQATASVTINRA